MGDPAEKKPERDAYGRLLPGHHSPGPGNPMARAIAAVRRRVYERFTPDHVERVLAELFCAASCIDPVTKRRIPGARPDSAAAQLFLRYVYGDPKRLEEERAEVLSTMSVADALQVLARAPAALARARTLRLGPQMEIDVVERPAAEVASVASVVEPEKKP